MNGRERRNKLIQILSESSTPLSGKELSKRLDVSRQVIVQDMALLRAQDHEILSTNQGYLLTGGKKISRVFKVIHSDKEVEEELGLIVDYGGHVEDVFVYHKVYGIVRADLHIASRNGHQGISSGLAERTFCPVKKYYIGVSLSYGKCTIRKTSGSDSGQTAGKRISGRIEGLRTDQFPGERKRERIV